ncbi:guanylate kinase [Salisediminibacterium halotolerans]|uniref:guanylate kinase n=1 Tax=Salisediminibacterium halotolerans TaxID=517425 RepID=UPI000EAE6C3D|nr:guanylate kinase [Salisediminibacterium halotolerans]RLJ71673.1 guanylate kinase [Actinophytocola xinjiangensis]RPE86823.1 guanylate kinase [Salisediminibacterium halotolerans]TWG32886.1 guanylate kinase [Salisediminibacterium halotolerans]GEL06978.1 guanylate kinase [Salisediminibacterium halotolerans]
MYDLKDKEMIFVFTGPDGSGRKTVANMAARTTLHMTGVISYTTRAKRPYETDGEDYHFISEDAFDVAKENGEFLEDVVINGYRYGIKEEDVRTKFAQKGCIYLVLNNEGADILKQLYGEKVIRIFIYADRSTVIERQRERGDNEAVIERHLSHYDRDMAYKKVCEHAFENYRLDHTAFEVTEIISNYLQLDLTTED